MLTKYGNSPLVKQKLLQLARTREPMLATGPRDIGIGIECTCRSVAGESFDLVQSLHNEITVLAEPFDHISDVVLGTCQGLHCGVLSERRSAGIGVGHETADMCCQLFRHHPVSYSPAGHGVGLRMPVENDRSFLHSRELADA